MDYFLQGPLSHTFGQAQPRLQGPNNGSQRPYRNHLFTRGGVDYWYREEAALGVYGPATCWVHWKTAAHSPPRAGAEIEYLE